MAKSSAPGVSLTERAYAEVKALILRGAIAPNAQIDEKMIAGRLGVSRTPVREALLRLKNEGLVEIERGRGIVVRALSSSDMHEIYQAITGMEVMAVFVLTARGAERAALEPLYAALRRFDAAGRRADLELWGKADEAFHRGLLLLCGNRHIEAAGLQFRDLAQRAHLVAMRLQPLEYLARSAEMHRALVELILAGDAEAAASAHFQQRRRGAEMLVKAVETFHLVAL
ncbi:MAG: GntR family transcriptional regulator [Acetobacteraceae bacterium]